MSVGRIGGSNPIVSAKAPSASAIKDQQAALANFKQSLIGTISGGLSQSGGVYALAGTPVDKFITKDFANMPQKSKQEFMKMYASLSKVSGGLVPQEVVNQTFGTQPGGYSSLISQIGAKFGTLKK